MKKLGDESRCRKCAELLEKQGTMAKFPVPQKRGDHFVRTGKGTVEVGKGKK